MSPRLSATLMLTAAFAAGAGGARLFPSAPASTAPVVFRTTDNKIGAKVELRDAWLSAGREKNAADRCLARLSLASTASASDCRRLFLLGAEENDASLQLAVAQRWASTAPEDFWQWLVNLTERDVELNKPVLMAAQIILLRTWARQNPDVAMAAAMRAAPRVHLSAARGEVIRTLLESDPEKAFSLAAQFTSLTIVDRIEPVLYAADPGRFVRAAGKVPPGDVRKWVRENALYDAVLRWQEKEPAAALAWVTAQNTEDQCQYLPRLVTQMAQRDFAAALALVNQMPPSTQQEAAGLDLVKAWAAKDPAAALAWAESHMRSRRLTGIEVIIDSAVESGAGSVAASAAALPAGHGRDKAIARVAWRWAAKDADAAMNWVTALPPDSARRAAFGAIGGNWVQRNPEKAAAWMQNSAPEDVPGFLVQRAGRQLALRDPADAFQWAVQMPAAHSQTAMRGVVGQLVWLQPQPEFAPLLARLTPTQQDMAVNSMVDNWAYSCEGPKPKWVQSLTPAQRTHARQRIAQYSFLDEENRKGLLKALE